MSQQIFRKVALDRLSSPEQLDQLMQVATPRGWVALGAMGALLVTTLAWGIVGSIPQRIGGSGILIRSGGVFEVSSPTEGRVTDISVRVGDVISEGQVVARLAQPELVDRIKQARAREAEAETEHRRVEEYARRDAGLRAAFFTQRRLGVEQSIRASETLLAALAERIRNERALAEQGLVTRQTLLVTVQEEEGLREKVRALRGELSQMGVTELQERNDRAARVQVSLAALGQARRELAGLEGELRLTSEVTSPFTGRVLEIMTEQGGVMERGQPLLTVDLTGKAVKALEAVVYIPSQYGKKIKPGMEIQISPSTVKKEEYGYLMGKVTYVSDFPATPGGMQRVLKNTQLVTTLSGDDAPYEVHADLLPNPDNPSSYRWSSSGGPPTRIQSGTLVSAGIVTERRRPITMVIPQLRRERAEGEAPERLSARGTR